MNRLTEKAINVRSEARDAYRVYRSAYDIANHYQREVLPLRQIITEEMQLRFSSMQVDVFALLTEARQRLGLAARGDRRQARLLARAIRPADRHQRRRRSGRGIDTIRYRRRPRQRRRRRLTERRTTHVFTTWISGQRRAGDGERRQRPRAGRQPFPRLRPWTRR